MNTKTYMRVDELPPRPDPETGEPRPPQAPAFDSIRPPRVRQPWPNGSYDAKDSERPDPPNGEAPALAWEYPDRFGRLRTGVAAFVLQTLGLSVLQSFNLTWMTLLWPWLIILVFSAAVFLAMPYEPCAAGAEWLSIGRKWIRLYELTEIDTTYQRGGNLFLQLTDSDGHHLTVNAEDLRERRFMYDLVYNGMLHSVVTGKAATEKYGILELPRPAEGAEGAENTDAEQAEE